MIMKRKPDKNKGKRVRTITIENSPKVRALITKVRNNVANFLSKKIEMLSQIYIETKGNKNKFYEECRRRKFNKTEMIAAEFFRLQAKKMDAGKKIENGLQSLIEAIINIDALTENKNDYTDN